jgi:hypothetical protein
MDADGIIKIIDHVVSIGLLIFIFLFFTGFFCKDD